MKAKKLIERYNAICESEDVTIVVLTREPESDTVVRYKGQADKRNISCYIVNVDKAFIDNKDHKNGKIEIHNYNGEEKKLSLDIKNTVGIIRGSCMSSESSILDTLSNAGMFLINTKEAMQLCRNKISTGFVLKKNNIKTPESAQIPDEASLSIALKSIGGKFPAMLKVLTGSEGVGVVKVDNMAALRSTAQALWKQGASVLLQEYFPIKYDLRVLVMDGKILGSMQRNMAKDDFRSNVAQGGSFKAVKLKEDEEKIALAAAKATGCFLCGVDIIRHDGELYVLEVNGSAGSGAKYMHDGKEIDGDELIGKVVDYISDRSVWKHSKKVAGLIEWITIDGVGKTKAKLDTGNESYNCIHAEDMSIDGESISFKTFNNVELTKKIEGTVKIRPHNNHVERRAVVLFDVKMGGVEYKDVPFSLTSRDNNSYEIILGKKFLESANYVVDVSKKFLLK